MKSDMAKPPPARIYAIVAREADVAVVFRRGPSRQVRLLRWNLRTDEIEAGQWFKGRIYERSCDLSPNGEKLVHFAASMKPPLLSWTAVSRPPYLTALVLWPKGDCWNGGGWFLNNRDLVLNHLVNQCKVAPGFEHLAQASHRRGVRVLRTAQERGEDFTVLEPRMVAEGWRLVDEGSGGQTWSPRFDPPVRWQKQQPRGGRWLELRLHSIGGKDAGWYRHSAAILDKKRQLLAELAKSTGWTGIIRETCLVPRAAVSGVTKSMAAS
jgi:hypothetical protein